MCLALALGLAACSDSDAGDSGSDYPSGPVTMSVGADPGSGLDLTMRALVEVLDGEGIVTTPMPVENHPGDASAVWTAQMVEKHAGDDDQVSVASLVTMTNHARGQSAYNVQRPDDDRAPADGLLRRRVRRRLRRTTPSGPPSTQ